MTVPNFVTFKEITTVFYSVNVQYTYEQPMYYPMYRRTRLNLLTCASSSILIKKFN